MPKFSDESFTRLSTCHIDLQTLFYEVIKYFDCTVLEGYRNKETQEADFEHGKTKLHWPNGEHNKLPSMAVDIAPCPIDFDNTKNFYWFAGYVMGIAELLRSQGKITHSLRWGGNWERTQNIIPQKFNDLVHFELI